MYFDINSRSIDFLIRLLPRVALSNATEAVLYSQIDSQFPHKTPPRL